MRHAAFAAALLLSLIAARAWAVPADEAGAIGGSVASRPTSTLVLHSAEQVANTTDTTPCVIDVLDGARFTLSNRSPQATRLADVAATAGCPGAWSRVVANVSVRASGHTAGAFGQLRIGTANVAGLRIPATTVSAPAAAWSTSIDVTDYIALLRSPQQAGFHFGGSSGTNAALMTRLSLTFFPAADVARAASVPDRVQSVLSDRIDARTTAEAMVPIPRNTVRLAAAVQVRADGGCSGGWWLGAASGLADACADPPMREIALYIDGRLVGLVVPKPDLDDSAATRWWAPLTAPGALVTRTWKLDLTPFVGMLTDDRAHAFMLRMRDQSPLDAGQFHVDLHLLAHTARSPARTVGRLLYARASSQPAIQSGSDAHAYRMRASDRFEASGWLRSGDEVATTTTISQTIGARAERREGGRRLSNRYDYQQRISRTITTADGRSTVIRNNENNTVIINRLADGWDTADIGNQIVTVDGKQAFRSRRKDSLSSLVDAAGQIQSSREWSYADSSGRCANNRLVAESSRLLARRSGRQCIW